MKVTVFSTKPYDRRFLTQENEKHGHELVFVEAHLNAHTAPLAGGSEAVCAFVNDTVDRPVIEALAAADVGIIALRCAGYNNVDLEAAAEKGLEVVNVPAYSPHAVAEHTAGMILALSRGLHKAYARVREGNFSLDGLLGFDLYGKTAGVVGTGKIGRLVAGILNGFGCRVLAYDKYPAEDLENVEYVDLPTLYRESHIVTFHCPLTPETHHMLDAAALETMHDDVMVINTSRGGLIDTRAVIESLKSGKISRLGLDVYEEENDIFFENLSSHIIQDDVFSRLLTFPNVLVTGHQAFFTQEAMTAIAQTTLGNLTALETGAGEPSRVTLSR